MKRMFWQSGAVVVLLASGTLPALGQHIGATVDTVATSAGHLGPEVLAPCSSHVGSGRPSESTSLSCGGGSAAPPTTIAFSAAAAAPQVSGELAQLRSSTRVSVDTSGPKISPRAIDASAIATFQDVILFGDSRADHMELNFQLTGAFDTHSDLFFPASKAIVDVSFRIQDGFYDTVSNAGASYEPFSEGYSYETMTFVNGVTTLSSYSGPSNAADYLFTSNGTGGYTVTLGPSFFDNPLNTGLVMQLSLGTEAQVTTDWFVGGSALDATADFSHTFSMTSLFAFDADDNDITSEAFAGFASDGLPAPEPASTETLTAAGLLALAVVRRRP